MKYKIIIGVAVLIAGILGYLAYTAYQFAEFLDDLGECGMSIGPIYGDSIMVDEEDLKLDQQIEIPDGKFGLMNLSDSLAPKLLKFGNKDNLDWAVEFREDSSIGIPFHRLSEMKLIEDEYGIRLSFLNNSYGEPGKIYLTEEYELKYMCLSPM